MKLILQGLCSTLIPIMAIKSSENYPFYQLGVEINPKLKFL